MEQKDKDFMCTILEARYVEVMQEQEKYAKLEEWEIMPTLFPNAWISSKDYDKKMNILAEAIKSKTCLLKLPGVVDFEEGIRN